MTVRVLEGFAGPGGWSEAARMLGIGDHLGIELNAVACATAEAAGHTRLQADIRSLNPDDFRGVTGWISAPPCPTFTAAGKRSGVTDEAIVLDGCARLGDAQANTGRDGDYLTCYEQVSDERTALALETLKFAFRLPHVQWVVAEQVPAVEWIWQNMAAELAMAHDFASCHVITLRYDDFGVATRRRRTFLVATRHREPDFTGMPIRARWSCGRFQPPTEHAPNLLTPFPVTTMAAALDLPAGVRFNSRGDRKTPGGNEFGADQPAPSLTGNGFRSWYRTDLGKPDGYLTPEQGGLLQGFPADYPWQGSRTARSQRVADTVSPLAGAAVIGAALGLPWQDAVWSRIEGLYGHARPVEPFYRPCLTDARAGAGQLDLFAEVA